MKTKSMAAFAVLILTTALFMTIAPASALAGGGNCTVKGKGDDGGNSCISFECSPGDGELSGQADDSNAKFTSKTGILCNGEHVLGCGSSRQACHNIGEIHRAGGGECHGEVDDAWFNDDWVLTCTVTPSDSGGGCEPDCPDPNEVERLIAQATYLYDKVSHDVFLLVDEVQETIDDLDPGYYITLALIIAYQVLKELPTAQEIVDIVMELIPETDEVERLVGELVNDNEPCLPVQYEGLKANVPYCEDAKPIREVDASRYTYLVEGLVSEPVCPPDLSKFIRATIEISCIGGSNTETAQNDWLTTALGDYEGVGSHAAMVHQDGTLYGLVCADDVCQMQTPTVVPGVGTSAVWL